MGKMPGDCRICGPNFAIGDVEAWCETHLAPCAWTGAAWHCPDAKGLRIEGHSKTFMEREPAPGTKIKVFSYTHRKTRLRRWAGIVRLDGVPVFSVTAADHQDVVDALVAKPWEEKQW